MTEAPVTEAPVTEAPVEETEAPAEETEEPAEETEEPAVETEAPVEETEEPAAETEAPAEETEEPVVETEVPVEETEEPTAETEAPAEETEEPAAETETPAEETEEPAEDAEYNKEETENESSEEVTPEEEKKEEESEEDTEVYNKENEDEENAETVTDEESEASEEVNEEEENEEETAEEGEEFEEEAEDEENDEEESEEETEVVEEEIEEEAEPITDEQLIELGYRKVRIQNRNGADVYVVTATSVDVIGHLDYEAEIWIMDIAAEGWAQIYTDEDEAHHFIKLAEIEKQEITEDDLIEMGYRKIQIQNKNGTNVYASAEEDAVVTGTIEFESEIWIKDAEAEGWAQIFTEDEEAEKFIKIAEIEAQEITEEELIELGYRKIQIMNANGTDVYEAAKEDAAVIEHLDPETEIWVKDIETEGWAQIYTAEDETEKFILLAETEKQPYTDEEMLEMGYIKAYVCYDVGANVYAGLSENEGPIDHLDVGKEIWVKLVDGESRAAIINQENTEEEEILGYISLVDIIATMKPEGIEDLPTREIVIHSSLDGTILNKIFVGTEITLTTELINFNEDDNYVVKWQYSEDGEDYFDIEDAEELDFTYVVDKTNGNYIWKVIVKLIAPEE